MAGQTEGDSNAVLTLMAKMFEAQREQNEMMKAEMENQKSLIESQKEAMKQQNEAIQALLSDRAERSETWSELSESLRHRGPSIDALEKQIRNFSYNPEDGDMADGDKGRLLLRHVDDRVYKQLVDHIRPKKTSDLTFEEIITIKQDLFGDKKSVFERRFVLFSLKMSRLKCEDIKVFSAIVNRVVEEANFKEMPLEQFKAIVMLAGMDLPRHAATMFHVMNKIREDEKLTIQSILEVVDVYKEVYRDAQVVTNQSSLQVNAVRNNSRWRDQRSKEVISDMGKRCEGCDRYHKRADCPHINTECFKCHEIGHLASKCKTETAPDEKDIGQERKVNVIRTDCADCERYSLFDVEMKLNGQKVSMIADTGSDLTIISEETWRKIGKPYRVRTNERAVCANRKSLILSGMCQIDMEMNGVKMGRTVFITVSKLNVLGKDNFGKFFQLVPRLMEKSHQEIRMPGSTGNYESSTESSHQDEATRRDLMADETYGVVSNRLHEVAIDQDEGSLKRTRMPGSTEGYQGSTESSCRDEAPRRDLTADEACVENSDVNKDGQDKASPERTSGSGSTEDVWERSTESKICEVLRRDLMASTLDNIRVYSSEVSLLESEENSAGKDDSIWPNQGMKAGVKREKETTVLYSSDGVIRSESTGPNTGMENEKGPSIREMEYLNEPVIDITDSEVRNSLVREEPKKGNDVDEMDATTAVETQSIDDIANDDNGAPRRSTRVRAQPKRLDVNFKNKKYDEE